MFTMKQARKSSEDTQVAGYARFEEKKFGVKKVWAQNIFIDFLAELDNFKKIIYKY